MSSDCTRSWAGKSATVDPVTLGDGRRVRVLTAGSGPALVLLHTLRTQLDYFQRLIPLLTDHYTVYAIDLPGLGWSDADRPARYDEPSVRRAVIEVIDRLGLKSFALAGESIGATLSLSIASDLGSRVTRVIALNTYDYPVGVERANALASFIIKAMRVPGLGLVVAKAENAVVLGGILKGGFADASRLPRPFVEELIRSAQRPGFAQAARAYLRNHQSYVDAKKLYGRITVPVTLVYGDEDWSTPAEREEVAKRVRGSRVISLASTGHFSSMERPEAIARIILDANAGAVAA